MFWFNQRVCVTPFHVEWFTHFNSYHQDPEDYISPDKLPSNAQNSGKADWVIGYSVLKCKRCGQSLSCVIKGTWGTFCIAADGNELFWITLRVDHSKNNNCNEKYKKIVVNIVPVQIDDQVHTTTKTTILALDVISITFRAICWPIENWQPIKMQKGSRSPGALLWFTLFHHFYS